MLFLYHVFDFPLFVVDIEWVLLFEGYLIVVEVLHTMMVLFFYLKVTFFSGYLFWLILANSKFNLILLLFDIYTPNSQIP